MHCRQPGEWHDLHLSKSSPFSSLKKLLDINNCTNNILYSSNYLKKNDIIIIKKYVIEEDIVTKITDQKLKINDNFINSILNHNKNNYNIILKLINEN